MPSPQTTDKYPIWLKQAVTAMVEDPEKNLPMHLPFQDAGEVVQFRRLWYGYSKALAKEEALEEKMTGTSEFLSKQIGQMMLRKLRKEETPLYPDCYEEFVIMMREDDPRTKSVQGLFANMIAENAMAELSPVEDAPVVPVETVEDEMGDTLSGLGYFSE